MIATRRERLLAAGIPPALLPALQAELDRLARSAEGELPYYEIHAVLAAGMAAVGLDGFDTERLRAAWSLPASGFIALLPGAAEFLGAIKEAGLGCWLLSNAFVRTAADYRVDLAAQGLLPWIDGIVSSVDTRWRKPDRRIFEAALGQAGAAPGTSAMVGNSEPKDIVPAKALGLRTIRVCIEEPVPATSAADALCASLAEAAAAVREFAASI